MTRLLARKLIAWLRPRDIAEHPSFPIDYELERKRLLARETLVQQRKNVDRGMARLRVVK